MKNTNRTIMIGTIAATLAAVTLAGCGNMVDKVNVDPLKKSVDPVTAAASAVSAAADKTAAPDKTDTVKTEDTKAKETKSEKTEKSKKTKKAKKAKKSEKTEKSEKKQETKKTETAAAAKPAETAAQKSAPTPTPTPTPAPAAKAPTVSKEVYPVWVEGDLFAGTYCEETAGRAVMEVTRNSDDTYSVQVTWNVNANEKNIWNFSGEIDGRQVLRYYNCRKSTVAFDEYGNYTYGCTGLMTPYTTYTAGSGWIKFDDFGITWSDDMGDVLAGTVFVPYQTKPTAEKKETKKKDSKEDSGTTSINTESEEKSEENEREFTGYIIHDEWEKHSKADEEGTAGSCYYENEGFETGFFYAQDGSGTTLEIRESAQGAGLYDCTVTEHDDENGDYVYHMTAWLEGDKLVYADENMEYVEYDEIGNMEDNWKVDGGHSGSIEHTDSGFKWKDSDGNSYTFGW